MPKFLKRPLKVLARWFLAGFFTVLPLVVTVAIIVWVGGILKQLFGPKTVMGSLLRRVGMQLVSDDAAAYLLGIVLVLAVILGIGVAVESGARSLLQRLFGALMARLPVLGNIYRTTKQIVDMLDQKADTNLKGMTPVFCFFGEEKGGGVLALLVSPDKYRVNGRDYYIVIVPTAPVPIGGGLLFVPVEIVRPADMSVEGLMSVYVSMGISAPQFLKAGTTK